MKSKLILWSIRVFVPFIAVAFLIACGGGGGSNFNNPTKRTLTSVIVTPGSSSLPKGKSVQFSARASYSDGSSADVTATATWASSANNVASVGNAAGSKGSAQAVAIGSSTISAAVGGGTAGSVVTGTSVLTVSAATLDSIAVIPSSASVALGLKQ